VGVWRVFEPVWRSGTTCKQPANLAVEAAEESLTIKPDYTPTVRPAPALLTILIETMLQRLTCSRAPAEGSWVAMGAQEVHPSRCGHAGDNSVFPFPRVIMQLAKRLGGGAGQNLLEAVATAMNRQGRLLLLAVVVIVFAGTFATQLLPHRRRTSLRCLVLDFLSPQPYCIPARGPRATRRVVGGRLRGRQVSELGSA
jgi:hypothetical protein